MSRTYKAMGINLKSMPLGEYDRLVTVLTPELGLIRAVVPGARKHKSKLGGRSSLFVVNELLLCQGKNLDKIIQAETIASYPALGQDLGKLTASQYIAELVLNQALSHQPQVELFSLLTEHLSRLNNIPKEPGQGQQILAYLSQATFQLLALAGMAPQVHACCLTQRPIVPDLQHRSQGQVGFSIPTGGIVDLAALEAPQPGETPSAAQIETEAIDRLAESRRQRATTLPTLTRSLSGLELALLQALSDPCFTETALQDFVIPTPMDSPPSSSRLEANRLGEAWITVEQLLRQYAQYYFEKPIRSAVLIDTCFSPPRLEPSLA